MEKEKDTEKDIEKKAAILDKRLKITAIVMVIVSFFVITLSAVGEFILQKPGARSRRPQPGCGHRRRPPAQLSRSRAAL